MKKTITLAERPWALRREYQRFLGTYRLHRESGLYFSSDMDPSCRKVISSCLLAVPPALLALARQYGLTVSTCRGATAAGHSSTFYADFNASDRKLISPHIELGEASFQDSRLPAHLVHELSHLWWRHLPQTARAEYSRFILNTCVQETIELTDYAHGHMKDYRRLAEDRSGEPYVENHRAHYLKHWVEESFCETVAALACPCYPSVRSDTTVNLADRRRQIESVAGLSLSSLCA